MLVLKTYREIDAGENWNYWFDCNSCKKRVCVNPNILNSTTGKKKLLDAAYYPNVGMIPQIHENCMSRGQGFYVKDGQVIKPFLNDKNRKELYKPLSKCEIRQIEYGRVEYQKLFYNDSFYRSKHIESKIKQ